MKLSGPLLLVGCGKMGGALLEGWLARGLSPQDVWIVEPGPAHLQVHLQGFIDRGVHLAAAAEDLPAALQPALVVFAVKPQMLAEALPHYRGFAGAGAAVLSIAAGWRIAAFEEVLGAETPVVRAMPNTPAAVGRGMTVLCANPYCDAQLRDLAGDLLGAVGETAWVDDEGLIDAVTAVSGGGPAYVFLLIECLAEAGVAAGLPSDLAMQLARVTVSGAGVLVDQSSEPAATLRANVTSPGGTTLEALKVLMADDGLQPLMTKAIAAAAARSRALG
ncbi:pyrroline-5-carboxylate reductase [Pelagibius litoralis]|uniref:Pyrroline-5-carboxylate reductase n=1 Tax=Pelagibius litoralis TaxID=374515 RepID=A0A967F2Y3_9PROT|nr:pyrroline-5-carboxylate reductase [Pelagibius litoralis]NIA71935.1 pyrroline-5-carboxylate reductase [Pelagibius litoralis]